MYGCAIGLGGGCHHQVVHADVCGQRGHIVHQLGDVLRLLLGELRRALREAKVALQLTAALGFIGFGVFAVALAARIWTAALPLLGGAR